MEKLKANPWSATMVANVVWLQGQGAPTKAAAGQQRGGAPTGAQRSQGNGHPHQPQEEEVPVDKVEMTLAGFIVIFVTPWSIGEWYYHDDTLPAIIVGGSLTLWVVMGAVREAFRGSQIL